MKLNPTIYDLQQFKGSLAFVKNIPMLPSWGEYFTTGRMAYRAFSPFIVACEGLNFDLYCYNLKTIYLPQEVGKRLLEDDIKQLEVLNEHIILIDNKPFHITNMLYEEALKNPPIVL